MLPLGGRPPDGASLLLAAAAGPSEALRTAALYRGLAIAVLGIALTAYQPTGGYLVAMAAASTASVPWALLIARLTATSVFVVAALATRSPPAAHRAGLPALVTVGLLIVAADSLYAIATTQALLSLLAVLGSLYRHRHRHRRPRPHPPKRAHRPPPPTR